MHIGPFIPCFIDAFFPEVGIATLELLERFGHEVVYPHDQTCCGQPMADSRFNVEAADTEALFVRNFSGFDYVVALSGSIVSADSSCLMHQQRCAERISVPIKFIHIAQILNGAAE
jgi:Fe-S oxidoreductase